MLLLDYLILLSIPYIFHAYLRQLKLFSRKGSNSASHNYGQSNQQVAGAVEGQY